MAEAEEPAEVEIQDEEEALEMEEIFKRPPKHTYYMSQMEKSQAAPKQPPFQYPGWGLPIDYPGYKRDRHGQGILFANALSEDELAGGWAS